MFPVQVTVVHYITPLGLFFTGNKITAALQRNLIFFSTHFKTLITYEVALSSVDTHAAHDGWVAIRGRGLLCGRMAY